MKNHDNIFSTGGWAKEKAGLNAHWPFFPPHVDKAEPETLDTGVWLGGVWGWYTARIHLHNPCQLLSYSRSSILHRSVWTAIPTWMPAHPAMLQLCPAQSFQSGSHPVTPAFCEPFTALMSEATAGADTCASCDAEVSNPGTTLPCFSSAFARQVSLAWPEKEHVTGLDPFRSFCLSYCGNTYLWQEQVWGDKGFLAGIPSLVCSWAFCLQGRVAAGCSSECEPTASVSAGWWPGCA